MNNDRQLEERLRRLSWPVDRGGGWADIKAEATAQTSDRKRPSARTRWSGLRVAVYASIAVVVVAAVAFGSLELVRYLERPNFVLTITDDTSIGSSGQTTGGGTGAVRGSGYWEPLPLPQESIPIETLLLDPKNPSDLYVDTAAGLFKSSDGAESWHQTMSLSAIGVEKKWVVAFDPTAPSTVYMIAGLTSRVDGEALLRSVDGGATWVELSDASVPSKLVGWFVGIWFDTTSTPSTVYMWGYVEGGEWSVYRSTDRGETWTKVPLAEQDQAIALKSSPRSMAPMPAAAQQALDAFRESFDGSLTDADTGAVVGVIPAARQDRPDGAIDYSVIIDPSRLSTLYAATRDGVYKSTDGGQSWRKASGFLEYPGISNIIVDPRTPSTLYAATTAGIYRSLDGGRGWTLILEGDGSIVQAPSDPARLYAWTSIGLYRSDDGGETWTGLPGYGLRGGPLIRVAADNPDVLFALAISAREGPYLSVSRSTDGGNTWSEVLEVPEGATTVVVADPKTPSVLLAAASNRVFKSTDTGGTWTLVSPPQWKDAVVDITIDPHNSSDIYAVQSSETGAYSVSRSVDGGATWEKVGLEGPAKGVRKLVFDPRSPDTLYVLTSQVVNGVTKVGIYRSTDGGATWQNIVGDLPDAVIGDLAIDPASSQGLYALTGRGLFKWVAEGD